MGIAIIDLVLDTLVHEGGEVSTLLGGEGVGAEDGNDGITRMEVVEAVNLVDDRGERDAQHHAVVRPEGGVCGGRRALGDTDVQETGARAQLLKHRHGLRARKVGLHRGHGRADRFEQQRRKRRPRN